MNPANLLFWCNRLTLCKYFAPFSDITHHLLSFRQNLVIPHPPEEAPIIEQTPMALAPASGATKKSPKGDNKQLAVGKGLSVWYIYLYPLLFPYLICLL
jgi:hypothetical protein